MSKGCINIATVGITVADMDRSIDFYTDVLAFEKITDREAKYECLCGSLAVRLRIVTLKLGEQTIMLTEFLTAKGRSIPIDARSNDRTFQHIAIVVSDMQRAYQQLRHHGVFQISSHPQTLPEWNPTVGGIQAFYFKDPDGHNLELIHFPPGKGNPKWQGVTEPLFLGIDHTAIVVADTTASRAFYCDMLGLELQQESQNIGLEQAHLSGVHGAQVQISSLQASMGLGIELLEYLEPDGGKPMPIDTQANDLWFWQTTIAIESATAAPQRSCQLIQDPDGHMVCLVTLSPLTKLKSPIQ